MNEILDITNTDIEMLIKALESYKHDGMMTEMMVDMLDITMMPKPEDPVEARKAIEQRQKEREERRKTKELEREKLTRDIDFLKAKLTILLESKIRAEQKQLR